MLWRLLVFACAPALVLAQFGGFFQQGFPFHPFGQGQQQQQQQPTGRQHKGWTEMDAGEQLQRPRPRDKNMAWLISPVHCRAGYVCPGSLACVPTPADCPCPYMYVPTR